MRRRIRRQTLGKDAIKKSTTLIGNTGSGVATIYAHTIIKTDVGVRLATGATSTIIADQTNSATCNVGNIIKYLNICIQLGSRGEAAEFPDGRDA